MSENKKLSLELLELINNFPEKISQKYKARIEQGNFTKEENPESHFCVYFAAYDSAIKRLFIGHHKKSGLWLFNGGHIDEGETIRETLYREIGEEWGLNPEKFVLKNPELLTITEINNPTKQTCRVHYDMWFFVPVNSNDFKPGPEKIAEEFHEVRWLDQFEAEKLVKDVNTLLNKVL